MNPGLSCAGEATRLQEQIAIAISQKLKAYLDQNKIKYELVAHIYTESSEDAARSAHIPLHQMAKAVVLEDEQGYIVGVLPSNNRIEVEWVNEQLGRELELANEGEFIELFSDCNSGAVPALSFAYGVDLIWDEQLGHASDIYIEAGDHEHLVHLRGEDFNRLMSAMPRSIISARPDYSRWV
jgi:Ala-tRNA(Pro) deacylase